MSIYHEQPHGGDISALARRSGLNPEAILDFSASINPLGFPEWLRPLVSTTLEKAAHYPDPGVCDLVQAACRRYNTPPEEVLAGNGTAELISLLPLALDFKRAVIPAPTYADYARACLAAGLQVQRFNLDQAVDFALDPAELVPHLQGRDLVFICRPNNPTGLDVDAAGIRSLAAGFPDSLFVVDEAFGDFVPGFDSLVQNRPGNVMVLLSMTKMFALPGLRLGLALADPEVVRAVSGIKPFWSVNVLAYAAGVRALQDHEFVLKTREYVARQRHSLSQSLGEIPGIKIYPGQANFLLLGLDERLPVASELTAVLLEKHGLAVRDCSNFQGLDHRHVRVAVRSSRENQMLVRAMHSVLTGKSPRPAQSKQPAIMFQGTSSNAGKSILAAAMCRILLQDGYRPAPFKSQNMSLNSFVTSQGGEMGRAQVVQAQAARLEPDVRMNPVLLKPSSQTGCQVIINGQAVGNMGATGYVDYKPKAFQAARDAYDSLGREFDVLVLEGAGSPAEINLKSHDIVNMAMAEYARSPVLIVGDIDRGGVFASFAGTMEVLAEWERKLIRGFVVNKFRGDASLLGNAFELTLQHTGRPVVGVVPYIQNLDLPDEDSVGWKEGLQAHPDPSQDSVRVGVVDLPHISNFTDFDALRLEPDVSLETIRSPHDLQGMDAVIIPGSKNVFQDLAWLEQTGLKAALSRLGSEKKVEIIGICGGLQMLGNEISDPFELESPGQKVQAAALLDIYTEMAHKKTLTRMEATHIQSGLNVLGYEIHHGVSRMGGRPLLQLPDGKNEGIISESGLVWGTYLHGIFDADGFRRWFIDSLRSRKGLKPKGHICCIYNPDQALDRLAELVRSSLDLKLIYKWMGLKA